MRLAAITLFVLSTAVFAGVAKADDSANRSPELQVLDRFAGTWDVKFVNKPVGGEKVTSDLVSTRAWSRGGTFIRFEDANNLKNPELPEFQMLLTYDPDSKNYPAVTMNGASRGELTGTWDEKTQTMAFTTTFPDGNKFASTHRFIGKSRAEASGTVKNPDGKLLAELSWNQTRRKDAAKVADASDPKPPASPDLNALNRKQRNPIAPELLAAADTIRRLNEYPFDETSEELSSAIRLLEQSTDTEGANSLALQLANHQVAEGINNVRFVGFQILASRDRKSTLKFLQSIVDRLPENERQRAMELHRAVTRRVVGPRADNRRTSKPAPTVPDKTRVPVAMAFGEPIYMDQLEPGKTLAQTQNASQRQAHRGRRLLELISRQATKDYRRREKLEVTAEMKKSLWESVMRAPLPPNTGVFCEEERRLMSFAWQHASLMDWVLTKSLYERYGGRVGMGSLGLWLAADGRNQLIKDYQKSGEIRIEDAEIEKALWKEATKPNFADVYPKGEHLKRLLAHPPHLRHSR